MLRSEASLYKLYLQSMGPYLRKRGMEARDFSRVRFHKKHINGIFSVALSFLLTGLLVLSVYILCTKTIHHCCGHHCPICDTLEQCRMHVREAGSLIVQATVLLLAALISSGKTGISDLFIQRFTPVSNKVRIDD